MGKKGKEPEVAYVVYRTTDYSIFKVLYGNRGVKEQRKEKIQKSIKEIGWMRQAILVNENYEIIDGQGRFQALMELGLPIEYTIQDGVGIEECRVMNINQTNWTLQDYIESYAKRKFPDYIRLQNLVEDNRGIGLYAIGMAINGSSGINNKAVKEGTFECTEEQFESAKASLMKLQGIRKSLGCVKGRVDILEAALVYIIEYTETDYTKLAKKVEEYKAKFAPIGTLKDAFDQLQEFYNIRNRGEYANFWTAYQAFCRDRNKRNE